jgi:GNAT superfamily N-acetyltransferase
MAMTVDKHRMLGIVRKQLAVDMNCDPEDFTRGGIVYREAALNEGRRLFDRQTPFVEIATMGGAAVVSADKEIMPKVKAALENKTRDDIFAAPFIYGHSLYYVPDCLPTSQLRLPEGFELRIIEGNAIHGLYGTPGFENAIQYDTNHPRPDVVAAYASCGDGIAAMAGASADSGLMWQIGIDVLPRFRNQGLAAVLVGKLTELILERGIVPYYGTASSNIASQAVAHRSGFAPAWMCSYRHTFNATKDPW